MAQHPGNRQPPPQVPTGPKMRTQSRRAQSRSDKARQEDMARHKRWNQSRLAIPYSTDGPKVTLGIIWFGLVLLVPSALILFSQAQFAAPFIALVFSTVAGLAGLQIANTWLGSAAESRSAAGLGAFLLAFSSFFGLVAIPVGALAAFVMVLVGAALTKDGAKTFAQVMGIMIRSIFPVGIAAASAITIAVREVEVGSGFEVFIALILVISAYEIGDFIVGSGAHNAFEGPIAGFIALVVVTLGIFLFPPAALPSDLVFFAVLGLITGISGIIGQMFASILLPRPTSWAPALRRLDSYLLAAPIWLGIMIVLELAGQA